MICAPPATRPVIDRTSPAIEAIGRGRLDQCGYVPWLDVATYRLNPVSIGCHFGSQFGGCDAGGSPLLCMGPQIRRADQPMLTSIARIGQSADAAWQQADPTRVWSDRSRTCRDRGREACVSAVIDCESPSGAARVGCGGAKLYVRSAHVGRDLVASRGKRALPLLW